MPVIHDRRRSVDVWTKASVACAAQNKGGPEFRIILDPPELRLSCRYGSEQSGFPREAHLGREPHPLSSSAMATKEKRTKSRERRGEMSLQRIMVRRRSCRVRQACAARLSARSPARPPAFVCRNLLSSLLGPTSWPAMVQRLACATAATTSLLRPHLYSAHG